MVDDREAEMRLEHERVRDAGIAGLAGAVRYYSAQEGAWAELCPPTTPDRNEMFIAELEHFLRCAREGEPVQVDAATGRRVVEIALAIKRSSDRGETVRLDGGRGE